MEKKIILRLDKDFYKVNMPLKEAVQLSTL